MTVYETPTWHRLRERVLERDADCALARILGECEGALCAHHIDPISDGGPEYPDLDGLVVLCHRHHRMVHGLLNRQRRAYRCPHKHTTLEGRRQCERRHQQLAEV